MVSLAALLRTHIDHFGEQHPEHLQLCPAVEHYTGSKLPFLSLQRAFMQAWGKQGEASSQFGNAFTTLRSVFLQAALRQQAVCSSSTTRLHLADAFFEAGNHREAICTYFLAAAGRTSCFTASKQPLAFATNTLFRLVHALLSIGAVTQAAALAQYLDEGSGQMAVLFRMVQANPGCLDATYFPYVWDVGLLELFVAVYAKAGEEKMVHRLVQQLASPVLNVNNAKGSLQQLRRSLHFALCAAIFNEFTCSP